MPINKKLIHFQTKANFQTQLDAGNLLETSIVFIKDTQEIWTHGKLYPCPYSRDELDSMFADLDNSLVQHESNNNNPHEVTKEQVGLGNVDNTSDLDKPISTATKEELDAIKENIDKAFKDIEIQKTISQLHPSSDITKDLIVEMNDGTLYTVPNIDWSELGEGSEGAKAASVNYSNPNFSTALWETGAEYLPKFKRVISYGDLSSVNDKISIYQIPGEIPYMWPDNTADYQMLLPLEQQEVPNIPSTVIPREFGLSNLRFRQGFDLTFNCQSTSIPFGIFYLSTFKGSQYDDSTGRKYGHELNFTNTASNSSVGDIFYGTVLDPRGIHITGLGKMNGSFARQATNWTWLPSVSDTKPEWWSFDLSKYATNLNGFILHGEYSGEDRFTWENPMDMNWLGVNKFSGSIVLSIKGVKYFRASLPKATGLSYLVNYPDIEGIDIPELGAADVTNIAVGCTNLKHIRVNMANVTKASNMFWAQEGNQDYTFKHLTDVQLYNLKTSINLSHLAALSLESVKYIFDHVATVTNQTITLYTDVFNKVPKQWIEAIQAKGWTIKSSDGFSKFGKSANALKEDINYLDNKITAVDNKLDNHIKIFKTKEDLDNAIDTLDNKLAFVEEVGNEGIYAGGKFYQTIPSNEGGSTKDQLYWNGEKGIWQDPDYIQWLKRSTEGIEWNTNQVDPKVSRIIHTNYDYTNLRLCVYNAITKKINYFIDPSDFSVMSAYFDTPGTEIEIKDSNIYFQSDIEWQGTQMDINGETVNVLQAYLSNKIPCHYQTLKRNAQSSSDTNYSVDVQLVSIEERVVDTVTSYLHTYTLDDPTQYEQVKEVQFTSCTPKVCLDGRDGEVMVFVPGMYLQSQETNTKKIVRLYSSYDVEQQYKEYIKNWEYHPPMLVSAYKCTILNEVPENMGYLSTLPVGSAVSIMNNNTYCRGGDKNSYLNDQEESYKNALGKCRDDIPLNDFREAARKSGKEVLSYKQYKGLYWRYVMECLSFNSQDDYVPKTGVYDPLTGGLGPGITNFNNIVDYSYRTPICCNGYTNDINSDTGVKLLEVPGYSDHVYANKWHNLENFFGDTYTGVDGILLVTSTDDNGKKSGKIYVTDNPELYGTSDYENMTCIGELAPFNSTINTIIEWKLGNTAELVPITGYSEDLSTYKCDAIIGNLEDGVKAVSFGGQINTNDVAGIGCINITNSPSELPFNKSETMIGYRTVVDLDSLQPSK